MVVSGVLMIHAHRLNHTLSFDFCRCTDIVGHLASHLFPPVVPRCYVVQ